MRDRLTGWMFGQTAEPFTKDVAEIRHIDAPLPPVEHLEPDTDAPTETAAHPVERLLQQIADNTSKQVDYDLVNDITSQMKQLPAAAGVLNIDVAKERPYVLITGDNGVPRNLVIGRGLGSGMPISPCPKGAVFLMEYPYTDQLSITYDAGTANDLIYIHLSNHQLNLLLVK